MLRHAQTHIVVSQMSQKSDSAIFYKRKRCTTIFLIEFFPRNGGGPGGPTQARSACPHFLGKILLKNCCASFEFVKNGTVAFLMHLTYHVIILCVSEHFQFAKRLKFVLCELSQFPKKRIRVHSFARVLLKNKVCKIIESLFFFSSLKFAKK